MAARTASSSMPKRIPLSQVSATNSSTASRVGTAFPVRVPGVGHHYRYTPSVRVTMQRSMDTVRSGSARQRQGQAEADQHITLLTINKYQSTALF
jgi:hypothetical protein